MQAKVDLAKRAFSEDLSDFVKLDARLGHLVVLLEAVSDNFGEKCNLARSWTHCIRRVLTDLFLHLLDHERVIHGDRDRAHLGPRGRIRPDAISLQALTTLCTGACMR